MYTESFAGDIDEILAAMEPLPSYYNLPFQGMGARVDAVYGLDKPQRIVMAEKLLVIGRGMMRNGNQTVTIWLDYNRRIVLHNWQQAANHYQAITKNDWFAGLEGKTAKPKIRRYTK